MKSPCIQVCTLTPDGKTCTGCQRTTSEIAAWSTMSDREKYQVIQRCLAHMWGTKCRECMSHAKAQQIAEYEQEIYELGEGLL